MAYSGNFNVIQITMSHMHICQTHQLKQGLPQYICLTSNK